MYMTIDIHVCSRSLRVCCCCGPFSAPEWKHHAIHLCATVSLIWMIKNLLGSWLLTAYYGLTIGCAVQTTAMWCVLHQGWFFLKKLRAISHWVLRQQTTNPCYIILHFAIKIMSYGNNVSKSTSLCSCVKFVQLIFLKKVEKVVCGVFGHFLVLYKWLKNKAT